MALDSDSVETLQKVKRGTPAKFVMLTKGIRLVNLVVYRRGSIETAKKRAKEAGTGEISFGVVEGGGANVSFKLALADGFDKPPTKDLTLKAYLAESNLDFKPTIEIVDQLPNVPMDDDGELETSPRQMPPQSQGGGNPYRSEQEWQTILGAIGQATDENAKKQRFDQAVADLKAEVARAKTDTVLAGDPNAKREVDGVHRTVAEELRSIAGRPLPQRQENVPSPKGQGPVYRTQNEWDVILGQIGQATDQNTKQQRLDQAVAELKSEVTQSRNDSILIGDPNAKREVEGVHRTVAEELRSLRDRALPKQEGKGQQQPKGSQPSGQEVRPRGAPQPPLRPQMGQQRIKKDDGREQQINDLKRRTGAFKKPEPPYTIDQLKAILQQCETDSNSDFGKVCAGMAIASKDSYEQVTKRLTGARTAAQKYIKDHTDPMIGKLLPRVVARRKQCETFLGQIDQVLANLEQQEESARALIETYNTLLARKQSVPFAVVEQIWEILETSTLSAETRAKLERLAADIQVSDQPRGYEELSQLSDPTEVEKAEVLLSHGCFKAGMGGTSDVRLLRNPDKSIAFAFKGARGEARGAKVILDLPDGACATREDLSSNLCQGILSQTGVDFGFPKSRAVRIDGKTGALIEGIRGKTVDPEERSKVRAEIPFDQEALDECDRNLEEMPDKITTESLQKVVLFSTLSCQWDCKWGNLMVEEGNNARPIDGGAGFPTQHTVNVLAGDVKTNREIPMMVLTQYPRFTTRAGQTLPQATQPMDPETVKAILQIDVDSLIGGAKGRRDEIVRDLPDLAPEGHTGGLLDDGSLERVGASIRATQEILRANPQMSLVEFIEAYLQWLKEWVVANAKPE